MIRFVLQSNGRNIGSMTSFASINPTTAKRSYATPAYLEPNIGRKNLLVLTDAQVTKVGLCSPIMLDYRLIPG